MFGALVVPSGKFGHLSILHETAIQQIIPLGKIESFDEFHACNLYKGTGVFEGIDEDKRFTAIRVLLQAVCSDNLPFVYAAVDRQKMANSPFSVATPLHSAFHMCLLGVENWARSEHSFGRDVNAGTIINWKDTDTSSAPTTKDDGKSKWREGFQQFSQATTTALRANPTDGKAAVNAEIQEHTAARIYLIRPVYSCPAIGTGPVSPYR
jgi:hypothetical protein